MSYKRLVKCTFLFLFCLLSTSSWSVVVLDSTYQQSGFKKAEDLAKLPQFKSLIYLSGEKESGSGSWIGNYQGHGYVLTAGHMFTSESRAGDYNYITVDGTKYSGSALFIESKFGNFTKYML